VSRFPEGIRERFTFSRITEMASEETTVQDRIGFRRTLLQVLAVQVASLVLLAILQIVYN
jgi:hypothetical protein